MLIPSGQGSAQGKTKPVRQGKDKDIGETANPIYSDSRFAVKSGGRYLTIMALVEASHQTVGEKVQVEIRGAGVEAEIVPLPFYTRRK